MPTMTYAPTLITSGRLAPDHDGYAFEIQWDGFNRRSVGLAPLAATSVGEES